MILEISEKSFWDILKKNTDLNNSNDVTSKKWDPNDGLNMEDRMFFPAIQDSFPFVTSKRSTSKIFENLNEKKLFRITRNYTIKKEPYMVQILFENRAGKQKGI